MTTSKGKVLLADDEPRLLLRFAKILEQGGFEVIRAGDGSDALDYIRSAAVDVIVSDINMPGLTGIELLGKAHERDADLPVILMTGDPTVTTAVRAVDGGAFRYLIKPFAIDELLDAVNDAIQLGRLAKLKREAWALYASQAPQMRADADLSSGLDRAIGSLWMAYQPIVSWKTRRTYAFEALVRSAEPSMPHPGVMLAAAERLGRVCEIGRAVRARVARDLVRCPADSIFVNLHAAELLDETLYRPDTPLSRLAERVVFEITERAALDSVADASERMVALRRLGYRIAVDDLGAGYAGLTSFALIEPEVVKFDMTIVRDVHRNPTKRRLIRSMNDLFNELGLKVIAEGVELAAERDALAEAGCDMFQGYLFARPGRPFPTSTF